jgi:hypothetical protein
LPQSCVVGGRLFTAGATSTVHHLDLVRVSSLCVCLPLPCHFHSLDLQVHNGGASLRGVPPPPVAKQGHIEVLLLAQFSDTVVITVAESSRGVELNFILGEESPHHQRSTSLLLPVRVLSCLSFSLAPFLLFSRPYPSVLFPPTPPLPFAGSTDAVCSSVLCHDTGAGGGFYQYRECHRVCVDLSSTSWGSSSS